MRLKQIGGRELSAARPFLILEAGVNHEGSREAAREMIDAAAESGADMIKFQSYKAGELAIRDSPAYWDTSKESTQSQYELFKRHDSFDVDDYIDLAEHCGKRGILFSTTCFDTRFVAELGGLLPLFKVASADINNWLLYEDIAAWRKPVIVSAGASTLEEVDGALAFLEGLGIHEVSLMHCVLEYPTPPEHANLEVIATLRTRYPDATIGWSDHVPPESDHLCQITAWLLGAEIIEKHFTLDKSRPGNDHYHAYDPEDVRGFLRKVEVVAALRGSGEKVVYAWEAGARLHARRSLVVARDLEAGTVIERSMLRAKRPGHGIPPDRLHEVLGKTTKAALEADHQLRWEDVT